MAINEDFLKGKEYFTKGDYVNARAYLESAISQPNCNASAYLLLGKLDILDQNYENAISNLKKYLDKRPEPNVKLLLAQCYQKVGEKENAFDIYQELTDTQQNLWEPFFELGKIYLEHEDFEKAKQYLTKAYSLDKNEEIALHLDLLNKKIRLVLHTQKIAKNYEQVVQLYNLLDEKTLTDKENVAAAYFYLEKKDIAKQLLEDILENGKGDENEAYALLYKLYDSPEKKKELINKVLKKNPNNVWAKFNTMLFKIDKNNQSEEEIKPEVPKPSDFEINKKTDLEQVDLDFVASGPTDEQNQNSFEFELEDSSPIVEDKEEDQNQIQEFELETDNENLETETDMQEPEKLEEFKLQNQEELNQTISDFDEPSDLSKELQNISLPLQSNVEINNSMYADLETATLNNFQSFELKKEERSIKSVENEELGIYNLDKENTDLNTKLNSDAEVDILIGQSDEEIENTDNIDLLYRKASNAISQRRYKFAIDILKKILELDPKNINALLKIGWCMQIKGKLVMAEHYYKKALLIDQNNPYIYSSLALFYIQKKDLMKAELNFKRSIKVKENFFAYRELGKLYEEQELFEKAKECYHKAFELNYEDEESYERLERLESDLNE